MSQQSNSRRKFLRFSLAGIFAGTVGKSTFANSRASLNENDPMAKALGYVPDVANPVIKKEAMYKEGSNCANCLQFKNIDDNGVGDCSLFPGKGVPATAWCKAWAAK